MHLWQGLLLWLCIHISVHLGGHLCTHLYMDSPCVMCAGLAEGMCYNMCVGVECQCHEGKDFCLTCSLLYSSTSNRGQHPVVVNRYLNE